MKRAWGVLLVVLAAISANAAEAPRGGPAGLNYDSSKPIQVNADTFAADLNQSTGTYRGNVVIVQGEVKLRANEVRVLAPDGKAQRMEARGNVVVDSPSGTARGDNGTYDVVARVIHLTGRVTLTKGQNVMRGSALDVHVATGQARLVNAGQQGKPGRVEAVFYPQQSTPANKPAATPPPAPARAQPAQTP
jgi:lipopolysaccharide export system protein LptA